MFNINKRRGLTWRGGVFGEHECLMFLPHEEEMSRVSTKDITDLGWSLSNLFTEGLNEAVVTLSNEVILRRAEVDQRVGQKLIRLLSSGTN